MADIRKWNGKVYPTIGGPLAVYLRDLRTLGIFGDRETDVVRRFVQDGICRALETKLIAPHQFPSKARRAKR